MKKKKYCFLKKGVTPAMIEAVSCLVDSKVIKASEARDMLFELRNEKPDEVVDTEGIPFTFDPTF